MAHAGGDGGGKNVWECFRNIFFPFSIPLAAQNGVLTLTKDSCFKDL